MKCGLLKEMIERKSNRNHEVKLKLDKEEISKIERKAKLLGLKTSQFIRMVALNCNINLEDSK